MGVPEYYSSLPSFHLDKTVSWAGLQEGQIHQQEAILEIITSETTYLERLLLIKRVRAVTLCSLVS